MLLRAALALLLGTWLRAGDLADASRGAKLLIEKGCVRCHRFSGPAKGLWSRFTKERLDPARLAGVLWGHADRLAQQMQSNGVSLTAFARQEAADLIAYFATQGYFEPPGDAERGSRVYRRKGCAQCHRQGAENPAGAQASPGDASANPIDLLQAMWLHASLMKEALENRKMRWPSLTTAEMADLNAYLRPFRPPETAAGLRIGDPDGGREFMNSKHCNRCHSNQLFAASDPRPRTFTELAAVLWNHAPMMTSEVPALNRTPISDLLGYLWSEGYFEAPGSVKKGQKVFQSKHCNVCHAGWPGQGVCDSAAMISALWKHLPAAAQSLKAKGFEWPSFNDSDMADLIAFANQTTGGRVKPEAK